MKRSRRLSRRPGPSCRKVHPSSSSVPSASLQPWRPGRAASFMPSPRPCESHLRRPQPPSARPVCAVCQGWVTKCHRPSGSPRRAFPWSGRLDVAVRASAGQTSPEAAPPGPPLAASGRLWPSLHGVLLLCTAPFLACEDADWGVTHPTAPY